MQTPKNAQKKQNKCFQNFKKKKGRYEYINDIYSPQLNNTRNLIVYLPPSFDENTLKTHKNIIIMHDGQNLFNAKTSFSGIAWDCHITMDELIVEGAINEWIIIGIEYVTETRIYEYTYSIDSMYGGGGLFYCIFYFLFFFNRQLCVFYGVCVFFYECAF